MSNPTNPIVTSSDQEFTTIAIDNKDTASDAEESVPSSSSNSNNNNNNNKEKTSNRMMRTTKNAWRRAVGCCKKSTPRTKIHLKEHQIIKRKKAFGMEYIDLLLLKLQQQQSNSEDDTTTTEEQLQQAVQSCMQDIKDIQKEIAELTSRIEQVSEETKSKLKLQPTGTITNNNKPIYPESGLYIGGDPSLIVDEKDVEPIKTSPNAPPEKAFSITSSEGEEDDSHPEKDDTWMPAAPPPSTPPPAVPSSA